RRAPSRSTVSSPSRRITSSLMAVAGPGAPRAVPERRTFYRIAAAASTATSRRHRATSAVSLIRRGGAPRRPVEDPLQVVEGGGFQQVAVEAGVPGPLTVRGLSPAGHRHQEDLVAGLPQ